MKTQFLSFLLLCGFVSLFQFPATAQTVAEASTGTTEAETIEWLSFEEAVERNNENQKPVFIDVYTDWCGWCKRMDKTTFEHPNVVKTMNQYFHAVKFDAEQKEPITLGESTYNYVPNGRRGVHELAVALLQNKLSYPTVVFLDNGFNMIQPLPGYRTAEELEPILAYIGSGAYVEQTFEEFQKNVAGGQ